ncbi:hypothetical protein [Pseudomonas kurunegalensis]|uniref:hypothetical protein n=1 Tax=Pseudomonas kurunegalensis TaxID=485880 RepID=UPI003557BD32
MSRVDDQGNLDIWLSRLSHISQFGLFALTVGALYYTVIPLYKTAALEESIARREAELTAMNIKLDAATASFEKIKAEIYDRNRKDLIQGIISVSPYCSGLMTPPSSPDRSEDRELGKHLLKVNAAQCLQEEFEARGAVSILTADDYLILKKAVESICNKLSEMQKKALMDIDTLPERAAKDSSILAPLGPYSKEHEEFVELIESLAPGIIDKKSKFKSALASTRTKISMDYVASVAEEILKLREIKWSIAK